MTKKNQPKPTGKTRKAKPPAYDLGFQLPPVEDMTAGVMEANAVADSLTAKIKAYLSAGIASADAIQGRFSFRLLGPVKDAIDAGLAVCQGVETCVKSASLATVGAVQEYLLTLPLADVERQQIYDELSALFGDSHATIQSAGSGVLGGADVPPTDVGGNGASQLHHIVTHPDGNGICPPGYHLSPDGLCRLVTLTVYEQGGSVSGGSPSVEGTGSTGPAVQTPGGVLLTPSQSGAGAPITVMQPPAGGGQGNVPCPPHTIPSVLPGEIGPLTSQEGIQLTQEGGTTRVLDKWYIPDYCACPPHTTRLQEYVPGSGFPGLYRTACVALAGRPPHSPSPTPPITPTPPGPPSPQPPGQCPCVTCKCDPCVCPKPTPPTPPKPPRKCPPGYHDDGTGKCVKNTPSDLWCLWKREADDSCYTTSPNQPPESPLDSNEGCFATIGELQAAYQQVCGQQSQPEPPLEDALIWPSGSPWCDLSVCENVIGFFSTLPSILPQIVEILDSKTGEERIKNWIKEQGIPAPISWFFTGFLSVVVGLLKAGGDQLQSYVSSSGCASPSHLYLVVADAILGILGKYIAPVFEELSLPLDYARHLLCPQLTLTADEALTAFLGNQIDPTQLRCLAQANNRCWEPFATKIETSRSKWIPAELVTLRRRQLITDPEFYDGFRRLGYLYPEQADRLYDLSEQIPFVSDLLRFMVRDVDDANLVTLYGMDTDFDVKWSGKTKEWSQKQGVTEDYARRAWRAHWSVPAPGQLFEMYHRLRNTPVPAGFADWREVVTKALEQQDILPFWIPHFLSISFRPLTRVDAKRAFDIGALDQSDLRSAFIDLGYSDSNADTLTRFTYYDKINREKSGKYTGLYVRGEIDITAFRAYLVNRGFDQFGQDQVVQFAKEQIEGKRRSRCIASYKTRFMKGEYDASAATGLLVMLPMDAGDASHIVGGWECEFAASDHHDTARRTIGWYKAGLITEIELRRRLTHLGYVPESVNLMVLQANAELGEKAAAEAAKRQRALERQAAKEEAERRRLARLAAQAAKAALKAEQQAEARLLRRSKAIDRIIKHAVKEQGITLDDATNVVTAAVYDLEVSSGIDPDTAIKIVTLAVESLPKGAWVSVGFAIQSALNAERQELSELPFP